MMGKTKFKLKPESFDVLGLVAFGFLAWIGYTNLNATVPLEPLVAKIILGIGILGLIIDGYFVTKGVSD